MVSFKSKFAGVMLAISLLAPSAVQAIDIDVTEHTLPEPKKELTLKSVGMDFATGFWAFFITGLTSIDTHNVRTHLPNILKFVGGVSCIFGTMTAALMAVEPKRIDNRNAALYKAIHGKSIHYAAGNNFMLPLEAHLKAGTDAFECDKKGRTPLMYAASKGSITAVKRLLKNATPYQINMQDHEGNTAALWAAQTGNKGTLVTLFTSGNANLKTCNKYGRNVQTYIDNDRLTGMDFTTIGLRNRQIDKQCIGQTKSLKQRTQLAQYLDQSIPVAQSKQEERKER